MPLSLGIVMSATTMSGRSRISQVNGSVCSSDSASNGSSSPSGAASGRSGRASRGASRRLSGAFAAVAPQAAAQDLAIGLWQRAWVFLRRAGVSEVKIHLKRQDTSLVLILADRPGMMVSPTAAQAE